MALTETRPDTDDSTVVSVSTTPVASTIDSILGTGDHKTIGRLWIGAGLVFLVAGLVVSLVVGIESADLGSLAIADESDQLIQIWSLGRDLLLFGAIVPILVGLGTFITPLQVGASSIAFARGAAAAFWTWFVAVDILVLSYIMNGGPAGGRVDYVVLWTLALGVVIASLLWALICIATTVLGARATGMSLEMVPATSWSFFVFAVLSLLALPVVLAQLVLAYIDVKYGFLPAKLDRASLTAIQDSIQLVPSLYWIGVPLLGMAVDIIGVHTGRPAKFHRVILAVIAVFAFMAYGVDFFSFGWRRPLDFDNGLLNVALLVSVAPILLVLGLAGESMGKGKPTINTPMSAALLSGLLLLGASVAAVLGAVDPILGFVEEISGETIDFSFDLLGTTFHDGVRALVIGAVILSLVGGVHHWGHKMWGRTLDDRLGFLEVLAVAGGTAIWGLALIVAGFLDQPALPLLTDAPADNVELLNILSTVGIGLVVAGAVLLLLNVLGAVAGRVGTAAEPWRGLTLEWATDSPPTPGNFASAPTVTSVTPLADEAVEGATP